MADLSPFIPPKGSPRHFFFAFLWYSSKKGGEGVSADPKVLSHFFFALKQSKANKCQFAKRLKTEKKLFLNFFLKNSGKSDSKIPKVRGRVRPF